MRRFANRTHAGRLLADALSSLQGRDDLLVLAIPRGGVPVGFEVAKVLGAALDIQCVRKLGAPGREELALGAIAGDGTRVLNTAVIRDLEVTEEELSAIERDERRELRRREGFFRAQKAAISPAGRYVVLVDDGIATGSCMHAAARAVRALHPKKLVVAVPLAPPSTKEELSHVVDEIICLETPDPFNSVGEWYYDFTQVSDAEVVRLLRDSSNFASQDKSRPPSRLGSGSLNQEILT